MSGARNDIWVKDAWHSGLPYTPAVQVGPFIFVSGLVPVDLATGNTVGSTIQEQTEQVLSNLVAVLAAADASLKDVVRIGVYLVDSRHSGEMNAVYARRFVPPYPARTTVQVGPLGRPEFLIEVDAVASRQA